MAINGLAITPDEIVADLGRDLKARRLAMNMTQNAVAQRAGISTSTLKRMEANGAGSLKDVVSVAWSLGLRDAFTGLVGPPSPTSIDDIVDADRRPLRRRARVRPNR